MKLKLNPATRPQLWIAGITAIWLVIFLILIAPFDIAELPWWARLQILPIYGIICFLGYVILIPLQQYIHRAVGYWTIQWEVLFMLLLNLLLLAGNYWYYKSPIVNGEMGLAGFVLTIYYPIFFLILTIILGLRWLIFKPKTPPIIATPTIEKITLRGDNKLDELHLRWDDLICVSSADNYVEVRYLRDGVLQKKLLRSTLKNVLQQQPKLLQVHRSYLINPQHFVEWTSAKSIALTQTEVPVTKTYRPQVLALKNSSHK